MKLEWFVLAPFLLAGSLSVAAVQERPQWAVPTAPDRSEGEGPFRRLILRGVTVIDGTGAPPIGPVDVVIRENRIANLVTVGYPGLPIDKAARPVAGEGDRELDLEGSYLLPGFIDLHAHIGGKPQGTPAEYVFKLWMAHGVTTIREPWCLNGLDWVLNQKQRSAVNEITAPRIYAYVRIGQGAPAPLTTPTLVRDWVSQVAVRGADGLKLGAHRPDIMEAAIDQARKEGLGTMAHLDQMGVARMNTIHAARLGLTTQEHWYGLPEALMTDQTLQHFRLDYNYNNEQHRFGEAGRLWKQAAPRGSEKWNSLIDELVRLRFVFVPTLNVYEASRDLMRARRDEWHDLYTLPSLWEFFEPNLKSHGSYWFYWTTEDEVAWKENYRVWMDFLNDFKNRGGHVAAGSDSGYIYKLFGFGYIRELEMLREAGFHPLEVIRSATLWGAEALGVSEDIGTVEPGKLADLVVVSENPLENLKVLYGTGAIRLNEQNRAVRVGGVRYTIKDGIVYDSRELLRDVAEMVKQAKSQEKKEIKQPGLETAGDEN